jgi:hypothetical protein
MPGRVHIPELESDRAPRPAGTEGRHRRHGPAGADRGNRSEGLTGATGPQGATGATGATGPAGPAGDGAAAQGYVDGIASPPRVTNGHGIVSVDKGAVGIYCVLLDPSIDTPHAVAVASPTEPDEIVSMQGFCAGGGSGIDVGVTDRAAGSAKDGTSALAVFS